MKHILLIVALVLIACCAWAQDNGYTAGPSVFDSRTLVDENIRIFPNPATDYIVLRNDSEVRKMIIFNIVGRPLKTFETQKGERYWVADLSPGNYLIQLLDGKNKIITTQRINKQ